MRSALAVLLSASGFAQAPAEGVRPFEVRLSAGLFLAAPGGQDFALQARLARSPWLVGVRRVAWTDRFNDPFTGRHLTDTEETRTGPTVDYLFRPEARGTWLLGGAVYRCTKQETSLVTGEVGRDATTAAFLGGGYLWTGRWFTFRLGAYLSPGTTLRTRTSVSSEDDSGLFDIQIQVGVRF